MILLLSLIFTPAAIAMSNNSYNYNANAYISTALIVSEVTDTTVKLQWSKPRNMSGTVTYKIFLGDCFRKLDSITESSDFPEYRVINLTPGTVYKFQVLVDNYHLSPIVSDEIITNKPSVQLPETLKSLMAFDVSEVTDLTAKLNWEKPDRNATVTGYTVLLSNVKTIGFTKIADIYDTSNSLTFRITNLNPGTENIIVVKAFNSLGLTYYVTGDFIIADNPFREPSTPTNLVVSEITDTTVKLQWMRETNSPTVAWYVIGTYTTDADSKFCYTMDTSYTTDFRITGLIPGHSYKFKVMAYNSRGMSQPIFSQKIHTLNPLIKPEILTGRLKVALIMDTMVLLDLKKSENNVTCTGYAISMTNATTKSLMHLRDFYNVQNSIMLLIKNLTPETVYQFQAVAFNNKGFSDPLVSEVIRTEVSGKDF